MSSSAVTPKSRIEHAAAWFMPAKDKYRVIPRTEQMSSGVMHTENRQINIIHAAGNPDMLQMNKHTVTPGPGTSLMPLDLSIGDNLAPTSFKLFRNIDDAFRKVVLYSIPEEKKGRTWTPSLRFDLLCHMLAKEDQKLDSGLAMKTAAGWLDRPDNWLFTECTGVAPNPPKYRLYHRFGVSAINKGQQTGWQKPVRTQIDLGPIPANLFFHVLNADTDQTSSALWLTRTLAQKASELTEALSKGRNPKLWDDVMSFDLIMLLLKDVK